MPELKPCPNCGSTEIAMIAGGGLPKNRFYVVCQNCGSERVEEYSSTNEADEECKAILSECAEMIEDGE